MENNFIHHGDQPLQFLRVMGADEAIYQAYNTGGPEGGLEAMAQAGAITIQEDGGGNKILSKVSPMPTPAKHGLTLLSTTQHFIQTLKIICRKKLQQFGVEGQKIKLRKIKNHASPEKRLIR